MRKIFDADSFDYCSGQVTQINADYLLATEHTERFCFYRGERETAENYFQTLIPSTSSGQVTQINADYLPQIDTD